MPTTFPTTLDDFTNPTPADQLSTPAVLHSTQHANANDAIEALETKVGADSSADPASLDFRLAALEAAPAGGDISGTGVVGRVAEFVTDTKTLQAAKIIGPAVNILTLTNAAAATLALNITAAKTLTLTAADNYALTIPATGTAALLGVANIFTAIQNVTLGTQTTGLGSGALGVSFNFAPAAGAGAIGLFVNVGANRTSGDVSIYGASYVVTAANATFFAISHQNKLNATGTGALNTAIGVNSQIDTNSASGGIGNYYGFKVGTVVNLTTSIVTGTVTNAYGLYVNPVTGAGTLNYSIYTNAAANGARFGHQLTIDGSTDVNQLKVTGFTTQTLPPAYIIDNTAATAVVRDVLKLEAQSTGTAANGFGAGLLLSAETATGGTMQTQAQVAASWIDATNATRKAKLSLSAYDTAARLGLEIEASGAAAKLAFYGGTTVVRGAALTAQLTTITHTAPATPDYAIQDMTQTTPWGFADHDEANSVLAVIANLQTRVAELEARLGSATGVNLFA
jgi:hypothetical protein